jgi:hypothetical protein
MSLKDGATQFANPDDQSCFKSKKPCETKPWHNSTIFHSQVKS